MTAVTIGTNISELIHTHRFCDNGAVPHPQFYQRAVYNLNRGGKRLGKCLWRSPGRVSSVVAAGGATRTRWRGAVHTGKFTVGMYVRVVMALSTGAVNPYATFQLVGVDTLEFYYGSTLGTPTDAPIEFGHFIQAINCSPNSDYEFEFADHDDSRLVSAVVYEQKAQSDTDEGYLPTQYAVTQPIYDALRQSLAPLATEMWTHSGGTHVHWSADTDAAARTRTSTTDINLLDNVSTSVSANSLGWTLDNVYRNTASTTTVPYVFKALGKVAAGAGGHVYLKNSAGTVLATLTITATSPTWYSTTVSLPNTEAKYDVHFDGDGTNLCTVYAVSLYEKA